MKSFKKLLEEVNTTTESLTEGVEEAKLIRKIIKDKFKLTARDVGVKNKYGGYSSSVNLTLKTEKALGYKKELEGLAHEFEKYETDAASGEILLGGNTYVFVQLDYKLSKILEDKIMKEFDKQKAKNGFEVGDSVVLYNTFNVHNDNGKTIYVSKKSGGGVQQVHSTDSFAVASGVMNFIGRHGDDKMWTKIK